MPVSIIDTPHNVESVAAKLAQSGVKCVIRYYNRENTSRFPNKKLTRLEAQTIHDAGMAIAVVFQQNHRDLGDFTVEKAKADAEAALACAKAIGQPAGSAIYVAVDADFFRSAELAVIKTYFETFRQAIPANSYDLGVYGSGTVATMLLEAKLVRYAWLARALGWSGSRDFLKSERWALYQDALDIKFETIDYDSNIAGREFPNFGQFALSGETAEIAAARTLFEVNSRTTLNLRGGPGLEFGIIRSLSRGQQVYGLARSGKWMQVDIEGDGQADGFVHGDYLAPLVGTQADLASDGLQPIDIAYQELERQVHEFPGAAVNPRIALYYNSLDGSSPNDDDVAWCSYFVNFCFTKAGRNGTGKANARSWLAWGSPVTGAPQRGDIAVFWRVKKDSWQGHVGFFVGMSGDKLLILGGNQGDAVSIRAMDKNQLLGIRRG